MGVDNEGERAQSKIISSFGKGAASSGPPQPSQTTNNARTTAVVFETVRWFCLQSTRQATTHKRTTTEILNKGHAVLSAKPHRDL